VVSLYETGFCIRFEREMKLAGIPVSEERI